MLLAQRVTWLWCLCLSVKPLHRLRVWCSDDVLLRASYDARAAGGCAGLRAFTVALRARCDGGLRRVRRSPTRVTPLPRGPEPSDDYWHAAEGWDRRSLVFRAASPKWESTSSYCHDATTSPRLGDKVITLRPRRRRRRRKAQEVVEEPRRQVVVLRREVQTVEQTRGARLPPAALGLA